MSIESLMGLNSAVIPTSIINFWSSGGAAGGVVPIGSSTGAIKEILSGALTANTYKSVLSVSGRGWIDFADAYTMDTTSRQLTLKITLDGVIIFAAQTLAMTTASRGLIGIGNHSYEGTNQAGTVLQRFIFNTSLDISVQSTLSETDKVAVGVNYGLRA